MSDKWTRFIRAIAEDEARRMYKVPEGHEPHAFVGRSDQGCKQCGYPDRNEIHVLPTQT